MAGVQRGGRGKVKFEPEAQSLGDRAIAIGEWEYLTGLCRIYFKNSVLARAWSLSFMETTSPVVAE